MKNGASKFRIYRTSTSPYFPTDFNLREKETLESSAGNFHFQMVDQLPCEILITNTHTDFSAYSKAQLNDIKLIIHPNSGYDNYSAELVRELKADVVVGSPIRDQAVAQYILAAFFRHVVPLTHQNNWEKARSFDRKIFSDMKITIIGHGHIGKIVTSCLFPLVKKLTIIDPFENHHGDHAGSDVIILACGLNEISRHLIDKKFLKGISPEALIINAARGELIKTTDLIEFLSTHPKAYAVLDVFEKEPCDFGQFSALKNITTTSHIAGVYNGIDQATIDFEKKVITDFFTLPDFKELYRPMILRNRLTEKGLI